MNDHSNKTGISDTERAAFKDALVRYFSGEGLIAEVFNQVEAGLIDRYYRRKKRYPDEMDEIEREAKAIARDERSATRIAFEARQQAESMRAQNEALDATVRALPELLRIVEGKPKDVEVRDADGTPYKKTTIPYPRDQIAAAKLLIAIGRTGLLPDSYWSARAAATQDEDKDRGTLEPIFGAITHFNSVSAVRPDGTRFTARLDENRRDAIIEEEE